MTDHVKVQVLDHGYVQLVESWGSDERIIEAARMSTQKGFEGWGDDKPRRCKHCGKEFPAEGLWCETVGRWDHDFVPQVGDEKLLAYLWKNNHATPFEMAGAIFEVQAPIFVFREWHRHRTQSYNEMSARYTPLPDLNYVPTVERLMANVSAKCGVCGAVASWNATDPDTPACTGGRPHTWANKQAGTVAGAKVLTESEAEFYRRDLGRLYDHAQELYVHALAQGVPKELARVHLPVGRYSRMRASANLRNWLAFLTLRDDAKAQWEIRQYAAVVRGALEALFPRTLGLFNEGKR